MYLFKQAFNSIKGQWSKSLVLLIIISISGTVLFTSYQIRNISNKGIEDVKANIAIEGTIKHNLNEEELIWKPREIIEFREFLNKIDKIEGVKDINYLSNIQFLNRDTVKDLENTQYNNKEIELLGLSSPSSVIFSKNIASLNDGRMFADKEIEEGSLVAIVYDDINSISKGRIKVGDSITLSFPTKSDENLNYIEFIDIKLKVIGTFNKGVDVNYQWCKFGNVVDKCLDTKILIPDQSLNTILENVNQNRKENKIESSELFFIDINKVLISLDANNDFDLIHNSIQDKIKESNKNYTYQAFNEVYNELLPSLEKFGSSSQLVFIIGIIMSIGSIALIMYIFLKDREREFWIYRSLGKYQYAVIGQIIIEVTFITLVALLVSFGIGSLITQQISNNFIVNNTIKMVSILDKQVISTFALILISTVLLSTLVPSIYIINKTTRRRI